MPKPKLPARIAHGVTELQKLVWERHPESEFYVHPHLPGRNEVVVDVFGHFEDQLALTEIVSERSVDLLIETGLLFILIAQPYDERPSLKQKKTA